MGNAHPVDCKALSYAKTRHWDVATASMQGFRETMEDSHIAILDLSANKPESPVFAGHIQDLIDDSKGLGDPTVPDLFSIDSSIGLSPSCVLNPDIYLTRSVSSSFDNEESLTVSKDDPFESTGTSVKLSLPVSSMIDEESTDTIAKSISLDIPIRRTGAKKLLGRDRRLSSREMSLKAESKMSKRLTHPKSTPMTLSAVLDPEVFVEKPRTFGPSWAVLGVLDGHAGKGAALFCQDVLPRILSNKSEITPETLSDAVQEMDSLYREEGINTEWLEESGTTCVFATIRRSRDSMNRWKVLISNTGDSRAIRGGLGGSRQITSDHKPDNFIESTRIRAAGGYVVDNRVDGALAVSRAIGDFKFKRNPEYGYSKQKVIATPDVFEEYFEAGDWLLIACDGIFEQSSSKSVAEFVDEKAFSSKKSPAIVCELLDWALNNGSQDNMTCILIQFLDEVEVDLSEPLTPASRAKETLWTHRFKPGQTYPNEPQHMKAYMQFAKDSGFEKEVQSLEIPEFGIESDEEVSLQFDEMEEGDEQEFSDEEMLVSFKSTSSWTHNPFLGLPTGKPL